MGSVEQINNLISKAVRSGKTDKELAHKGLTFGRWLDVFGECDEAAKWVTKYLAVYDKDAKAHKLLGEIYEKLDKSDAALSCYKNSLRVKPQQYELMLKVAEMHINPGPTQNPGRAQVWLDKAAVALPKNPQVYKLRMELHLAQEAPASKLEETILEELKKRPADPSLHVQYISFLKDQERLEEAFSYAQKTVYGNELPKIVENDLEWNQCLVDTCQDYTERTCDDEVTAEGIKAYSLLMLSICRTIWLSFEQEKFDDALENLAMLDNTVFSVLRLNQDAADQNEWNAILNEAKGQLYWLSGIALIHLATQDDLAWDGATKLSAACYAVSLSIPMADVSETWASWSKDVTFSKSLKVMGGFRLSQSAHMLYNLASISHTAHKEENEINERDWLREVTDNYCTNEGRRKVFDDLFGPQNYNPETSMICTDEDFSKVSAQLVAEENLNLYDTNAALGVDLQTWVWMGLQWRQNFDNAVDPFLWISTVFPDLQLSASSSAKYGNVWNLNRLDMESFIVGCVLYAEKAALMWKNAKPDVDEGALTLSRLPLPLCKKLATEQQNEWWDAACKLHYRKGKERIFNTNQVKATLRHGIESIRGSGNHGLQLMLIAGLAKHFAAKAYAIDKSGMGTSSAAWLAHQRRASQYWTLVLPLLQDVTINRSRQKTQPKDRLFPSTLNEPTIQEANNMISEVYMCNGGLLVQEGDLKCALDMYGKAGTPHASFCEALIYKQLLDNCDKGEPSITGSSGKKKDAYMRKYTARLEVTLNRLQREPDEELLRRTEELLHAHVSTSPSMLRTRESDPKRLFEETIPKQLPHIANHTVYSEVDDSVLAVPSKQSTPKSETRPEVVLSEKGAVTHLAQTLTTLTSALSTMQIQMNERMSNMEQTRSLKQDVNQSSMDNVCNQLEKLTTIVSGLQEKKDDENEEKRKMKLQIDQLQEQLSRSQFGAPVAPGRVAQLPQADGMPPGSPLQVFDHYQHASLGQIATPMQHGSPYIGVPAAYQGYLPHSPAVAAMYAQQGYTLPQGMPPPPYGQARIPQQVIDPRVIPSPVRTPPIHIRPQQTPSNTGLPMSKEAADALSMRFQASIGSTGSVSPGPMGAPSTAMYSAQYMADQHAGAPLAPSMSQPGPIGMGMQGRLLQVQSEPMLRSGQGIIPVGHQQQFPPTMVSRQPGSQGLDESYLPPNITNMAHPQGTSVLKSLLGQPEIHYPEHINFPERTDQPASSGGTGWSFKFQAPEDIDRDNRKLEADEEAEDAETSHNDTGPHFEPLVTLPEVEVRTGEEDEDAMFSERAKLYRWHEGQWKERGLGLMKILKHKETGKYRLLMRRDQVLKICCNHFIGESLDLQPMPKTDKAWMWHAMDFSEEGGKQEGLAIRFKTAEIAHDFKEKFIEGQKSNAKISGGTPVRPATKPSSNVLSPTLAQSTSTTTSFVSVSQTTVPTPVVQSATSDTVMPKFKFAFPKPSAAALDLAARIAGTPPKTPEQDIGKEHGDEPDGGEDDDVHNETGDGPHFDPIIKLPDKVETKTGEEDEEVLFCHRAKLYRFADKQWKERGVGDIKILYNKNSQKYRIVMRRDQVLKLCANHYITTDMTLAPMSNSDRAWTWTAMDHSDPDSHPQHEFLAIRFKSTETAAEFAKFFNNAKDILDGKEVSDVSESKRDTPPTTTPVLPTFTTSAPAKPQTSSQSVQSQVVDSTSKGLLVAKKEAGNWNCPMCYSPNLATDLECPCCYAPHPNAPKADDTAPKSNAPAAKSGPTFSFGISSGGSSTSSFSFGIKSAAAETPSFGAPTKPLTSSTTPTGFVPQSVPPVNHEEPSDLIMSSTVPQVPLSGPLRVEKQAGKWNCSDCYAENEPTDAACPCCGKANPNAPATAKVETTGPKPGLFSFGLNQNTKSTFSFGINKQASDTSTTKPDGTPSKGLLSPPKFGFGMPSGDTQFRFGLSSSFGTGANTGNNSGQQQQSSSLFSSNLGSNLPKPNIPSTTETSKPRFPSVGEDGNDYDEDSDEYETTDGESSEEDEEYDAQREERYRSPLNRPQQEQKQDEDNDVICLGEVLPSAELQKKAESLMLPKHFYNFVKDGEDDAEDASESEGDQTAKQIIARDKSSVTATVTATTPTTSQTSTFGSGAAAGSTFADIVKSNAKGGFAFGGESVGWVGMPDQKPLFANLTQHDTSQGEEYYQNEEADVHFEPVVKLPEKVETVTGEEDEEVLYSQRCKLYRYNKPTNEWKERGLGEIKMLKNLKTGRIRMVMRREQVLKVCANHYIRPGMSLDPNKTSDRAWTWTAMDFTEEEDPKHEVFTARFKSVEIAKEFKDKFDMCQAMLLDVDPMTPCKASSMRTQELSEKAEQMKNELRFFKDKFSEPPKVDLENTLTDESTLEQKAAPAVGSLTPLVAQHTASLRQSAAENTTQNSIFETPQKPKSLIPSDSKFSFQMTSPETECKKVVSSKESREHTVSVSSDDPQAEKDIHFEPIVQLPEKVDLITGEEDEQVIFGNRAKLYAFHKETKQWKERGLGDVKILQNFSTLKVRVVMRREQVFKVCLNHLIQQEYNLTFKEPTAGKTLLWTARDYSDEEKPDGEILQFALRFKTSEIANSFNDLWEAGADAAASKTLLDPDPSDLNTSMVAPGVTSPGPVVQSPQSPQSPVKQPTSSFSFANVPSPFDTNKLSSEGPVNVMGFVFGKPQESETSTPNNEGFKFDTSKMLFNFGGTSTPQGAFGGTPTTAYFTPPQTAPGTKTNASKSLFQSETDTTVDSNLFVSSSETFTQPDQASTTLFGDQSPAAQPKNVETKPPFSNGSVFGAVVKNYKPSPLAVASDATKSGSAFSHPSGRFQFKPVATEPSAQKITDNEAPSTGLPDDDDIIFVSELKPTDDQRKRAEDLLLPSTFFLFENKPMAPDFDEKTEDENEEKILKFIEDRNSGKLELKKTETVSSGSGDTAGDSVPAKPSDSSSNGSSWVFGGGTEAASTFGSIGSGSFAALAGGVQNIGFKNDPLFQFPGAGQVMFQSQSTEENEEHPDPASFKCDAQFKPVLKELPPLVEVKTGEEGEEVLFKERCKLYRYDKDTKQWKERGVGEIKILRNDEHKLHRVVMRRDQVYKVCTNHVIGENTNPELHLGSTKSCSYFVMDYSENQVPTPEKIAIRFKNDELCKAYMDKIAEIRSQQNIES